MPILYEIFLFFLLKQGVEVICPSGNADQVNAYKTATILPEVKILQLQIDGSYEGLQQVINLCTTLYTSCEVKTKYMESPSMPGTGTAMVAFASIDKVKREQLIERVRQQASVIGTSIQLQFKED